MAQTCKGSAPSTTQHERRILLRNSASPQTPTPHHKMNQYGNQLSKASARSNHQHPLQSNQYKSGRASQSWDLLSPLTPRPPPDSLSRSHLKQSSTSFKVKQQCTLNKPSPQRPFILRKPSSRIFQCTVSLHRSWKICLRPSIQYCWRNYWSATPTSKDFLFVNTC